MYSSKSIAPLAPVTISPTISSSKSQIPKFLRFLYEILQTEDPKIISWAHNGTAIQIYDVKLMEAYILPKYFRHRKYASFQRQLNYFGFRKWTKTQTSICTFSHPFFLEGSSESLSLIKRKNYSESSGNIANESTDKKIKDISSSKTKKKDLLSSNRKRTLDASNSMYQSPQYNLKEKRQLISPPVPTIDQLVPMKNPVNLSKIDGLYSSTSQKKNKPQGLSTSYSVSIPPSVLLPVAYTLSSPRPTKSQKESMPSTISPASNSTTNYIPLEPLLSSEVSLQDSEELQNVLSSVLLDSASNHSSNKCWNQGYQHCNNSEDTVHQSETFAFDSMDPAWSSSMTWNQGNFKSQLWR